MIRFRDATRADVAAIVALLADDPLGRTREHNDLAQYLAAFDAITATPMHQIIVGTDAGYRYSINAANGVVDTRSDQITGGVLSQPAVQDDAIYVGSAAGNVYAVDTTRRNPIVWAYPPSQK